MTEINASSYGELVMSFSFPYTRYLIDKDFDDLYFGVENILKDFALKKYWFWRRGELETPLKSTILCR